MLKHIEANQVDLTRTPLILGEELRFDGEVESAIDNALAQKALTRDYRPGFELPAVAEVASEAAG
jgi:hypothetical protein